jgi:hypothetical protein
MKVSEIKIETNLCIVQPGNSFPPRESMGKSKSRNPSQCRRLSEYNPRGSTVNAVTQEGSGATPDYTPKYYYMGLERLYSYGLATSKGIDPPSPIRISQGHVPSHGRFCLPPLSGHLNITTQIFHWNCISHPNLAPFPPSTRDPSICNATESLGYIRLF